MTAQEWLQHKNLGIELAKVLTPGPWRHEYHTDSIDHEKYPCNKCGYEHPDNMACTKCGAWVHEQGNYVCKKGGCKVVNCSIPDPIDINDWNVAMKRRDKMIEMDEHGYIIQLLLTMRCVFDSEGCSPLRVLACAQPKHYLIAAALAEGAKK